MYGCRNSFFMIIWNLLTHSIHWGFIESGHKIYENSSILGIAFNDVCLSNFHTNCACRIWITNQSVILQLLSHPLVLLFSLLPASPQINSANVWLKIYQTPGHFLPKWIERNLRTKVIAGIWEWWEELTPYDAGWVNFCTSFWFCCHNLYFLKCAWLSWWETILVCT